MTMSVKQKILDLVGERITDQEWLGQERNVELREIMSDTEFYLQKGQDAYRDFIKYPVNYDLLYLICERIHSIPRQNNWSDRIREELFNSQYSFNKSDEFANKMDTLITYLDKNARGRIDLNKYDPHRNVARAMIRQNDWYKNLVRCKLGEFWKLSQGVCNAINYVNDPMHHVSMVSEKDRIKFSATVLEVTYDNNSFTSQVKEMFSEYQTYVKNKQNFTIFCIRWLYDKDIKRIWQ